MRLLLSAATAALVLMAGAAWAAPPQPGMIVNFNQEAIVCDTAEQVAAIAEPLLAGRDAESATAYRRLHAIRNERDEPTCLLAPVRGVEIVAVARIGRRETAREKFELWSIGITNGLAAGVMLYREPAEQPGIEI